jgi:vacuolar-type H+-ATPase subunit I/STV1
MPTLLQKIRLVFRGWQRRRDEREKEFLTRNAGWAATTPSVAAAAPPKARAFEIDSEGLTVAYLDDSGQLAHFLDTSDGDIVDLRVADLSTRPELREPRYRRVPARSEKAEAEDRRAFIESLQAPSARDVLERCTDADAFRRALASDRTIERAWYNFRNDRAIAAIEAWLETI